MYITINWGIEEAIHRKCHDDIIYGSLNFDVALLLPYYKEIQDYKHAKTENIQKPISLFYWYKAFKNENTNEMNRILADTLMNIFKHFIPHKAKKFDCKYPESMDSFIISSLKKKKNCTKRFYKDFSYYNKDQLKNQASECIRLVILAKIKNIAKLNAKLDHASIAPQAFWSIISRFFDKRKVQAMPPTIAHVPLLSDFKVKSQVFNSHFAAQCTPVVNAMTLPKFKYRTDKRLNSFAVNENAVSPIIKNIEISIKIG